MLLGCGDAPASVSREVQPIMNLSKTNANAASVSWGQQVSGLRLGLSTDGGFVELHLQNIGTAPLEVLSHVNAGDIHLDWYTLRLKDELGNTRKLELMDERDKSGIVRSHLEPGVSIQHQVDVVAWAVRSINGTKPLAAGTYKLYAVYEVEPGRNSWSGRLAAGPIMLTVQNKT